MDGGRPYIVPVRTRGSVVEIKKSRFICTLKNVSTEEEALSFVEEIRKMYPDARHHCYACRVGPPELCRERFSDDGEPQGTAGKPMLSLLQGRDLSDVCAVVTRYFGGTLLGTGGLVKAYSDSVREALDASVCVSLEKGVRMFADCEYQTSEKLKFALRKAGVSIESEEYGSSVRIVFLVRESGRAQVETAVRELSAGRCVCTVTDELLFSENLPENGAPYIYRIIRSVL